MPAGKTTYFTTTTTSSSSSASFNTPPDDAAMLGSSLIPTRWRRNHDITADPPTPGYYNTLITPHLQSVSLKACTHPIRTICLVAVLGSVFYVNLLETGFFVPAAARDGANQVDFAALSAGSRKLHLGPETAWRWQVEENGGKIENGKDMTLITLDFLDSGNGSPNVAPQKLALPKHSAAELVPSSANILSQISSDTTLAFSVPYAETAQFLESVKEIPGTADTATAEDVDDTPERKLWLMKSAKKPNSTHGLLDWAQNSWAAFLDLIKNAETLDIIIMSLGYLSMYLTFISLFLSMRRMGSNFWLGTTTLFSSAFAFLFGLLVTMKLGVPENVVLLSEGVPFMVVAVGFEKPIMLTQAVLSAAVQAKKDNSIQSAVQTAVRERGFEIVRDYVIEIAILCAGAASGIQGGLRQFCFLAAWTLFFDCILLFTFYTSILTIKLEVNRIKRHVSLRKALEEDGVSRRVAENVASSNDWPNGDSVSQGEGSIFGKKARGSSVPRFKVLMVTGFIMINVLNLCSMPFRGTRNNSPVTTAGLSSVVTQPPMDPFKVAGNGLDHLFAQAKVNNQPMSVTVFNPIKYELQYPSVHYSAPEQTEWSIFEGDYQSGLFSSILGGRMVESLLKSFDDPALGKWVVIALALSLVLNGYLFNAARWSIKESAEDSQTNGHPIPPVVKVEPEKPLPMPDLEPAALDGSRIRTPEEISALLAAKKAPLLNDTELIDLALRGKIPGYALEKTLEDKTRAVKIRRAMISRTPGTKELTGKLENSKLPFEHFDYDRVHGACCENVVGYLPLPLGVAGPLTIDGRSYFLPMATTEGVLVASTSRGCKAINAGGGAITVLTADGMTRGPCIGFETLSRAAAAKLWIDSEEGSGMLRKAFNSTSRFARLQTLKASIAGTYVYVRFKTTTGDAMGMNMISKGVEEALR